MLILEKCIITLFQKKFTTTILSNANVVIVAGRLTSLADVAVQPVTVLVADAVVGERAALVITLPPAVHPHVPQRVVVALYPRHHLAEETLRRTVVGPRDARARRLAGQTGRTAVRGHHPFFSFFQWLSHCRLSV